MTASRKSHKSTWDQFLLDNLTHSNGGLMNEKLMTSLRQKGNKIENELLNDFSIFFVITFIFYLLFVPSTSASLLSPEACFSSVR